MHKRLWMPLLLLMMLALSACRGNTPLEETETPLPTIVETIPPTSQPTETAPAEAVGPTAEPGCTAISPRTDPTAEEESLFPPVSESDWVHGSETAKVTIIEYSDFQ